MIKGVESILLFSEDAKKLANFYKEKVGLKITEKAGFGEEGEEYYVFEMKQGSVLCVLDHSEVKGKNKQPERIMFNLEVDNIRSEVKRLGKAGIKKVQDMYSVPGYGSIATFQDIDGNFFQLVQLE